MNVERMGVIHVSFPKYMVFRNFFWVIYFGKFSKSVHFDVIKNLKRLVRVVR
jgi:hypothetical protein